MFGVVTGVLALVKLLLVEKSEGMMIACVSAEETRSRRFGDKKSEQVEVKEFAGLEVRRIESEVAEAPNLKRAVPGNAPDVIFGGIRWRHRMVSLIVFGSEPGRRDYTKQIPESSKDTGNPTLSH
jgi:hypothetical protein